MRSARLLVSMVGFVATSLVTTALLADESLPPAALEFFEKKVRPILVERCFECHSQKTRAENDGEAKGNLRLDSRAAALVGGDTGPALEPGKPDASLVIQAVRHEGVYKMPPSGKLPAEEIEALTRWVAEGALWPSESTDPVESGKTFDLAARKSEHWCWRPIVEPTIPNVRQTEWPLDAVDRFILSKVEAQGMSIAPQAEPRVRLRRLAFDLTGLPPTPEELAAFEADPSEERWQAQVDRWLASPRFGERWGRHWLDLVRYAETRGHEFDFQAPNAFAYRDYVIRAFNEDLSYADLIREHVAGDSVSPRPNRAEGFNEAVVATGFWALGEWVHSPVDIVKDEADRYDNAIDVFGKTFLGLTIACARCHNHKFDAISTKDYYALGGLLQSSVYRLARYDTEEAERKALDALAIARGDLDAIAPLEARRQRARWAGFAAHLTAARELIQPAPEGSPSRIERARTLAAKRGLSARRVAALVEHLESAAKDNPSDLLHPYYATFAKEVSPDVQRELAASFARRRMESRSALDGCAPIVDLLALAAPAGLRPWTDGPTYGDRAMATGVAIAGSDAARPIATLARHASVRRDPLWNHLVAAPGQELDPGALGFDRAGKVYRTPTFTLESGLVHYLVQGAGRAFASVDSHAVVLGPLHGHTMLGLGEDGKAPVRWVTHDLSTFRGHRVHIEFTPHADQDLQVLAVVQGSGRGPLPEETLGRSEAIEKAVAESIGDPAVASERVEKTIDEALARWAAGKLAAGDALDLAWLLERPELAARDDEISGDRQETLKDLAQEISARFHKWVAARDAAVAGVPPVSRLAMALANGSPENDRVMVRGNPHVRGAEAPRGLPEALAAPSLADASDSGRLEAAEQLLRDDNPLVRRVIVNRVWAKLFGRGIVPSVDNFGVLGQAPTHPELLDHLAVRFAREGWSIKRLVRDLALTRAYQMSSRVASAEDETRDPTNLLWRRRTVRRVEAEAIRDSILMISGRLSSEMHGPSVPLHLTDFLQGRGRPGASGPLDGAGRRSLYIAVRRNFPNPMLTAFDFPTPLGAVGQRNASNVPAQALILLNDPLVTEQATLWAARLKREAPTGPARFDRAMQAALGRDPTEQERQFAADFVAARAKKRGVADPWDDERALADLCHVLWNAKEFVFLE